MTIINNLKVKDFTFLEHLNCWEISLDKEIIEDRRSFSQIFIHKSLTDLSKLKKAKKEKNQFGVMFDKNTFNYSPFNYSSPDSEKTNLILTIMKKKEMEYMVKIQGILNFFKKIDKIYDALLENVSGEKNTKKISELDIRCFNENLEVFQKIVQQTESEDISRQIDSQWFNKNFIIPIKNILQKFPEKEKKLIAAIDGKRIYYESIPNTVDYLTELRKLPN